MSVPDYLVTDLDKPDAIDDLGLLEQLVHSLKEANAKIDELEDSLKELKKDKEKLSREEIPNLLLACGISEIKLKDKTKVVVTEELHVSVPIEKKQAFINFLTKRKEDDIVKTVIYLPRMPSEKIENLKSFLEMNEYEHEFEQNVHPQTLKKYFKTILGVGDSEREQGLRDGKYLSVDKVESVVNVFQYFETKLKT